MNLNRRDKQTSLHEPLGFLAGYGLAVASTGLAALARWLLPWALTPAPYLGFYPAVVVSAALGGLGPGLVATFSYLFLVNFVFGNFNIHDHGAMMRQIIWVTESFGVSLLAGMQRNARMCERRQAEELRETALALQAANTELDDSRRAAINLMEDALDARTKAEEAAAALRAREADLNEAQRLAHIGSWYWDAKTDVTTGSDELLRIFSRSLTLSTARHS